MCNFFKSLEITADLKKELNNDNNNNNDNDYSIT